MSNPARIPPAPDMPPRGTKLNPVSKQLDKNGCWRMLSDQKAYDLRPVCDSLARPVTELPPCEKFNVVARRWGYPDFEQTHPAEYNALKCRFLAGEFPQMDGTLPPLAELEKHWPSFLQQLGNLELWKQVADDDMREHWLVADKDRSPAMVLGLCASDRQPHQRKPTDRVTHADLELIKYCAVFESGDKRTIVYLSEFCRDSLTVKEMPHTPGHERRQGEVRAENLALASKTEKIIEKKANLVTAETKLEEVRRQRQKEDARLARERARKPVGLNDCLVALQVKGRRLRDIWKEHGFEKRPQTQGELDLLLKKRDRHRKALNEALTKRTKDRTAQRRA